MVGTVQRDLSSYGFASSSLEALLRAGYRSNIDVLVSSAQEFIRDVKLPRNTAIRIFETVTRSSANADEAEGEPHDSAANRFGGSSVLALVTASRDIESITTSSSSIDDLLGNGIPRREVTELCGAPGTGKTQLCMQLALNVQIPKELGGVGGTALYIDTEGSFMVDRVAEMGLTVLETIQRSAASSGTTGESDLDRISLETLLKGIYYCRVTDHSELMAVLHSLSILLQEYEAVKLIIIDSIAFHFRHGFTDMSQRARMLSTASSLLYKVADSLDVAVIVTNHVTTKFDRQRDRSHHMPYEDTPRGEELRARLAPALGETWSHCVTNRLMLSYGPSGRNIRLLKSPSRPPKDAYFQVWEGGIRDVEMSRKRVIDPEQEEIPATKRSPGLSR